jgi:hypothetical protein
LFGFIAIYSGRELVALSAIDDPHLAIEIEVILERDHLERAP